MNRKIFGYFSIFHIVLYNTVRIYFEVLLILKIVLAFDIWRMLVFYFFLSTLHTYYILKHILGRQALLGWSLNNRNNKNWGKQVPFECEKRVAFLTCLSSVARSLTAKQKAKKQATNIYYIMTATQNECHFLFGNRKRRQREKR